MANSDNFLEAKTESAALRQIRDFIREADGAKGENSPWFTFYVPFLSGTGYVISQLEKTGYEVEPRGWRLEVRALVKEVLDENGDDYFAARARAEGLLKD